VEARHKEEIGIKRFWAGTYIRKSYEDRKIQ
jgi:hypothetical protein